MQNVLTKRKETKTTVRLWGGGRRKKSENPEGEKEVVVMLAGRPTAAEAPHCSRRRCTKLYYSVAAERERENSKKGSSIILHTARD
jgi:hypothetical protein